MIKVEGLINLFKKNKNDFFSGVPDSVLKEFSSSLNNKKKQRMKFFHLQKSLRKVNILFL